jgi:hypothetical protein
MVHSENPGEKGIRIKNSSIWENTLSKLKEP